MRFIIGMLVTVSFTANVFAQHAANNVVDVTPKAQLEVVNDPVTTQTQNVTTTVEQTPVVIQNQPSIQVQKQDATIVEDSPLSESTADRMRRQRIELEQKVESKIVEKLEQDRIKAEQDRLDNLFKESALKKEEPKIEVNQNVIEAQPEVVAPTVIAPVQVVNPEVGVGPVVEQNIDQKLDTVETVSADVEVKTEAPVIAPVEEKASSNMTVGLDLGFISYTSVDNIEGSGTMGVSVGYETSDRFIVEAGFLYARSDIEAVDRPVWVQYNFNMPPSFYSTITEMEQYTFSGAFKYRILKSKVSPVVGALLAYNYRSYADRQSTDGFYLSAESTSIDFGFILGAEVQLSDRLKLTGDYRYVMNMTNDITLNDGRYEQSKLWGSSSSETVEEVGYSNFIIGLKYIF